MVEALHLRSFQEAGLVVVLHSHSYLGGVSVLDPLSLSCQAAVLELHWSFWQQICQALKVCPCHCFSQAPLTETLGSPTPQVCPCPQTSAQTWKYPLKPLLYQMTEAHLPRVCSPADGYTRGEVRSWGLRCSLHGDARRQLPLRRVAGHGGLLPRVLAANLKRARLL